MQGAESATVRPIRWGCRDDGRHVCAGGVGRLRRGDLDVAVRPDRPHAADADLADADLARTARRQSEGSAGALRSSSNSRSANAMTSSRCRLLRRARKLLMSRRPKAVISSAFNAASLGGIWMRLAADLPGLQP